MRTSIKIDALVATAFVAAMLVIAYFQKWNVVLVMLIIVGGVSPTVIKHVWWHYHPPK
jgi:hypothetical protein